MIDNTSELIKNSLSWEKIASHYQITFKEGANVLCPFHDDKTASLNFSTEKRLFNCFACEAQGDYFNFIALQENLNCKEDFAEVLKKAELIAGTNYLEKKNPRPKSSPKESKLLDSTIVQKNCSQLLSSKQVLDWFKDKRAINAETLKKASVGFGSHKQVKGKAVIHFAYENKKGRFTHNRIREIGSGKNVMSETGSKAGIYLASNLSKGSRVFVTEGEIDALTLFQHTDEVVGVSGSQSFLESFLTDFKHLDEIVFCGDNDLAGRTFNEKAIGLIKKKYPHIKTSYINWSGLPEKYDLNDFYLSLENKDQFINELEKRFIERDFRKISPLQHFDKGFACTTIYQEKIVSNDKGTKLIKQPYLITSDRKKIPLESKKLYENLIIVERSPIPHDHWTIASVEKFIKGINSKVTLKETFERIKNELRKYLSFEEELFYTLVTIWIMGTYFHRGMISFPYLALNGNKKCGKSKLLIFIEAFAFQALLNVGATAASTIRLVNSNHITCCVDEAENLSNSKDENSQALLGIYNSGYKKGAKVPKCGHKHKVELFESYSPKAFGGINALNDTTSSRCITLLMPPVKNRQNFNKEINSNDKTFLEIRDQLYVHMLTDFQAVLDTYKNLKSPSLDLSGRDWEIWKPILSLAHAISPEISEKMTDLALSMTKQRKHSDFSAEDDIEFLEIVLEQLERFSELNGSIPIKELSNALFNTDSDTFVEFIEESSSNRWIGDWLKRMGLIKKKGYQRKIGGINTRCYKISKSDLIKRLDALKG